MSYLGPTTIDRHVGQRTLERRKALGLTQRDVAAAIDVSYAQIQKYESGANAMSASRLWQMSIALDVPVSYFFDGVE